MNIEEVKNEAANNPDFAASLTGIIKESGYIVHAKDEHENYLKKYEDEKIAPRVREIYDAYDKDVLESTGIEKDPSEKSYEYVKRAIGAVKGNPDEVNKYKDKIKELEAKSPDESILRERDEYKTLLAKEQEIKNEALKAKDLELATYKKKNFIEQGLQGLKFSNKYPESVVNVMKENAVAKLMALETKEQEGQQVFVGSDGNALRDEANGYKFVSSQDLLKQELSDIIDVGRQATGTGSKPQSLTSTGEGGTVIVNPSAVPQDIKSQVELDAYLLKQGMTRSSAEFDELRTEVIKNRQLPLR